MAWSWPTPEAGPGRKLAPGLYEHEITADQGADHYYALGSVGGNDPGEGQPLRQDGAAAPEEEGYWQKLVERAQILKVPWSLSRTMKASAFRVHFKEEGKSGRELGLANLEELRDLKHMLESRERRGICIIENIPAKLITTLGLNWDIPAEFFVEHARNPGQSEFVNHGEAGEIRALYEAIASLESTIEYIDERKIWGSAGVSGVPLEPMWFECTGRLRRIAESVRYGLLIHGAHAVAADRESLFRIPWGFWEGGFQKLAFMIDSLIRRLRSDFDAILTVKDCRGREPYQFMEPVHALEQNSRKLVEWMSMRYYNIDGFHEYTDHEILLPPRNMAASASLSFPRSLVDPIAGSLLSNSGAPMSNTKFSYIRVSQYLCMYLSDPFMDIELTAIRSLPR